MYPEILSIYSDFEEDPTMEASADEVMDLDSYVNSDDIDGDDLEGDDEELDDEEEYEEENQEEDLDDQDDFDDDEDDAIQGKSL